jgi:hypothetical protein
MLKRFGRPSHATIVAYLALFVAVGGTTAYAANTVFSSDIVDGEVRTADLHDKSAVTAKLGDAAVTTAKLGNSSVSSTKIIDGTITANDLSAGAQGSGSPDWALVNAAGGIVKQSGGITASRFNTGVYSVTFPSSLIGRPLSATLQAKNDHDGSIATVPCGGTIANENASACVVNNTTSTALVRTFGPGTENWQDRPFYLIAFKP